MKILNTEINNLDDFPIISDSKWFPLSIRQYISQFEREIAFLKIFKYVINLGQFGDNYVSKNLNNIKNSYEINMNDYMITILRIEPKNNIKYIETGYILSDNIGDLESYIKYTFGSRFLYVHKNNLDFFQNYFKYDINNNDLLFNNLINILIMVKNAGDGFEEMLTKNLPYIDRYTILDTGSTDNTINIAKKVLANKRGNIYEESFINFRDSRNRLIELAGHDCTFNIMLDDTYILNGDIISFLDYVRGDEYADSYSLYIKDIDILYSSNRILKSHKNIKYKYTLHEIPDSSINVQIDIKNGYITDSINSYMSERTLSRKEYDLTKLFEDLITYNYEPRTYYYIAETYLNLKQYNNAFNYYDIRQKNNLGYTEEIQDSIYKMAFLSEEFLNVDWKYCMELYLKCYNFDPKRPDSLIIIGKHYYDLKQYDIACCFLEKALNNTIPSDRNMNVKFILYKFHLPNMLIHSYYFLKKYELGLSVLNSLDLTISKCRDLNLKFFNIFTLLNAANNFSISNSSIQRRLYENKAIIAMICPGGWNNWDGNTLNEIGLGGSEKWAIKYSEIIASKLTCQMIIFCNCDKQKMINNVLYIPIDELYKFISIYIIDLCFVSRYVSYLHLALEYIPKVYLVNHDLLLSTDFINYTPNLKGVINLSNWHNKHFLEYNPDLSNISDTLSYGIDVNEYDTSYKQKYSFIYSSFANRGLYNLLKLFPLIKNRYPNAILNVFSDTKHFFVQKYCKSEMDEIENLLFQQKDYIFVHGWVKPDILKNYWSSSHVWFYPTSFHETCCHTAYEAAASKTLVVTSDMAALSESACNGVIIPLQSEDNLEWNYRALNKLFTLLDNEEEANKYINNNYEWVKINKNYDLVTNNFINKYIKPHFQS